MEYTVWYEASSGEGEQASRSMLDETVWDVPDELEGEDLLTYLRQALQATDATQIRILSYELA